jgi:trimethylamine---corrinoid protein Co-methyltransferase
LLKALPIEDDMKFTGQFLNEVEQFRIHQESLHILADVGVKFHGEKALPLLAKNGAKVDWENKIAHIPKGLVDETLQSTPKSFVLGARNPVFNYPIPSPASRYCIDGTAAFVLDFETGQKRYGTLKDIENSLKVFQQMDLGLMAWAPTVASDKPADSRVLHEFFGIMRYTSKHGEHEVHYPEQVPYLVEGMKAVLGSEEAIRSSKAYSMIYCPVAPLMHDGPMLDAYLELGKWDLPIMILPMPVNGTTGPASLFSNLALANAEALSSIVIYQLETPGRPMIYSSAVGSVDFRNGAYLAGTPEMGIQSAAFVKMGQYYGIPSASAGCSSDAKEPGAEAILDKLITTIPPVCAGADIIIGTGEIEGDQLLILEQLIVDNEMCHICERLYAGVDSSESKDLYEDIAKVGPGGHFLGSRNTRRAARSDEFFMSNLIDRHPYESWMELGKPNMYRTARQKVDEILAAPVVDPLPESVIRKLDEILLIADKELAEAV